MTTDNQLKPTQADMEALPKDLLWSIPVGYHKAIFAAFARYREKVEQETLSREQSRDGGQLEAAVLDLPFANIAPIEWGDYEWGLLADTLSTPPASPEQPSPSPVTGEAVAERLRKAACGMLPTGAVGPLNDERSFWLALADAALTTDQSQTDRLRAALTVILGSGKEGTWLALVEPLVARFDVAANFGGDAVHNPEGSAALAELLREMASRLDRSVEAARAALSETRP